LPPRTPEEYEAEIAALEEEIRRLKSRSAMSLFGKVSASVPGATVPTILGVEEMVLLVAADDTVGYLNNPMMKLLGVSDRREAIGSPLSRWDQGPLPESTLAALVQMARAVPEPQAVERSCPEIPAERLPAADATGARTLRFAVAPHKGSVQIVVQDVTRLRWLESTFSRYVSPRVIERMQQVPTGDLLTMERREVSILFTDLRGFTRLCQEETPARVQETVNSFLSNMVGCVEAVEGTVLGFAGDQVMALFSAPLVQADHALRALICAAQMQRIHGAWVDERTRAGLPAPAAGVGLATGTVVVGNIGTPTRMDYTAQGHAVNLAARLCSAAGGGEVLTVPETHQAALSCIGAYQGEVPVPRFTFAGKGKQSFKNVAQPVEVLSVGVKA
jgi:class 3 adenylate cyclase